MSKKMGRPKVAKAKLRGIIVNARLSPEENKVINEAIRRTELAKSDWIRRALLSASASDKPAS